MEQRRFGNSGLSVSVLSFGTMTIGGRDRFGKMGNLGVSETARILDVCRDAGVTTIDTADIYSFGAAEEILGEALQGRRDEFVLVTKGFMRLGTGAARCRAVAKAPDAGVRGQPAPAADRLHRPVSRAPAGHDRRGRRDDARVRRPRHAGEGSLRRLLQQRGVAGDEGACRVRSPRAHPLRLSAGELQPARTRRRARDHPARPRSIASGSWPGALSMPASSAESSARDARPSVSRLNDLEVPGTVDFERLYRIVDTLTEIAQSAERHARAGGAELGDEQAGRRHRHHRRARRGAAARQPCRGRLAALG